MSKVHPYNFISDAQQVALSDMLASIVAEPTRRQLAKTFDVIWKTPELERQRLLGDNALAYIHYEIGDAHWYFTELDSKSGLAYGHRTMDAGKNWRDAHCSIKSLKNSGAQLDIYFEQKTITEIKNDRCKL